MWHQSIVGTIDFMEAQRFLRLRFGCSTFMPAPQMGINQSFIAQGFDRKFFAKLTAGNSHRMGQGSYNFLADIVNAPQMLLEKRLHGGSLLQAFVFVEGTSFQDIWESLPRQQKLRLAEQAATFLKLIHDIDRKILPPPIPAIDIASAACGMASQLANDLSKRFIQAAKRSGAFSRPQTSLCHGDFSAKNLIINNEGKVVVVDWEWTAIADTAFDLKNIRLAIESGHAWAPDLLKAYNKLTPTRIPESRLLLADIYYSLIMIRFAARRRRPHLKAKHLERCIELIERLEGETKP